ncbi:MAG TPA: hypothetical protein VHP58_04760 [Alphaproteobacteria bacterium]|nr:hypothetical protein [Alphaproteobacteria bacterium]
MNVHFVVIEPKPYAPHRDIIAKMMQKMPQTGPHRDIHAVKKEVDAGATLDAAYRNVAQARGVRWQHVLYNVAVYAPTRLKQYLGLPCKNTQPLQQTRVRPVTSARAAAILDCMTTGAGLKLAHEVKLELARHGGRLKLHDICQQVARKNHVYFEVVHLAWSRLRFDEARMVGIPQPQRVKYSPQPYVAAEHRLEQWCHITIPADDLPPEEKARRDDVLRRRYPHHAN